jgi:large subunit ribosomal protein L1
VSTAKLYPLADAIKMVKERAKSKFDGTRARDQSRRRSASRRQMVRGVVTRRTAPATLRVGVFARGAKAEEAKAAGADVVGAEEPVEKVQGGTIDFDRCIATPT